MALTRKDIQILAHLRANGRETLTRMSKKTGIPISTLYDRLQTHKGTIIKQFTSIIDFAALGYGIRSMIFLKVSHEHKTAYTTFLTNSYNANTVHKVNNEYDYIIDAVFKTLNELEDFKDKLHEIGRVEKISLLHIVDQIKSERFLADPDTAFLTAK